MSEHEKEERLGQQAQQIINDFQTNYDCAIKPFNDLAKSFQTFISLTNILLKMKDEEIKKLKELKK